MWSGIVTVDIVSNGPINIYLNCEKKINLWGSQLIFRLSLSPDPCTHQLRHAWAWDFQVVFRLPFLILCPL